MNLRLGKLSYPVFYFGLYTAYLIVLFGFVTLPDAHHLSHDIVRLIAPLIELGLGCLICMQIRSVTHAGWLGALIVSLLFAVVYIAQTYSLYLADSFISVLAIQNRAENRLVRSIGMYMTIIAGVLWWLALALIEILERHRRLAALTSPQLPIVAKLQQRKYRYATPVLAITLLLGELSLGLMQGHSARLQAGFRQVPAANLLLTLRRLVRANDVSMQKAQVNSNSPVQVPPAAFAYQKNWIYKKPMPFSEIKAMTTRPNIIVIFTEGMSASLIDAYGGIHSHLTPNIDRFADQSTRVVNYFNHTAATYRALQGQMESGYPLAGGSGSSDAWETANNRSKLAALHFASLPSILNHHGYTTKFISPHPDSVALNTMLRSLGFDEVYSPATVNSELKIQVGQTIAGDSLTDQTLFDALRRLIETKASPGHPPLFAGVYNIGTHAFLDTAPGGLTYENGSNQVLNRFHNYDKAVGSFLSWFMASPYAKNTVLIFTADHATFPDKPFHDAEGASTQPFFVAPIPLLIHDPFYALPKRFDAHGANSVGFAPMVLQMIGIASAPNSFLGRSIFDGASDAHFGVSAIGQQYLLTDKEGVFPTGQIPSADSAKFFSFTHEIQMYYREQETNTVFNPK